MVHSVQAGNSTGPRRCVVLAVKEASPPTALLAGLSQRQVTTVLVYDPASAMLQLAEAATTSLIVVQPQRQIRLGELVTAVGTYFPKTRIWQYAAAAGATEPTLSKLELPCQCQLDRSRGDSDVPSVQQDARQPQPPEAEDAQPADAQQPARNGASAAPEGFLAAREQMARRRQPPASTQPGSGRDVPRSSMEGEQDGPLISPQELAMLLGSPEDEADTGGEEDQ